MALSRRQFVGLGGLFVASAIAPLEAADPSHRLVGATGFDAAQEVPLTYLNRDTFTRLVGTRFMAHTRTSRVVPLTLITVEDLNTAGVHGGLQHGRPRMLGKVPAPSTQKTDAFALRFRGPAAKVLSQDSYVFESGSLGKIALFIVPGGKAMRVPTYTAIINRLQ